LFTQHSFPVAFENGPKRRVFAQAIEWIGWCRAGKDEVRALKELLAAGSRYAQVASRAGFTFSAPTSSESFEIVERVAGTATTDFGAVSALLASDSEPFQEGETEQLSRLLQACWATFDEALMRIPAGQREVKPERGRSPDAIQFHLLEADLMHLSAFGPAFRQPKAEQVAEQITRVREEMLVRLAAIPPKEAFTPSRRYGFVWTPRFAVRRSAWHALDHAWEIEERFGM